MYATIKPCSDGETSERTAFQHVPVVAIRSVVATGNRYMLKGCAF
jgi:hypothetical protein